MIAALILEACVVDQGYTAWVLNDSSATVVVDAHTQRHATVVVPPHTYGPLFEVSGTSSADWTVRLVDGQCGPIVEWPADVNHDLVYISPAGERTFVAALAWDYGLKTATEKSFVPRDPPCP